MYLDFYRFKKSPFHITPDPEFLFLSESHKEASACLIYGIEERKGFLAITGEIGVGKTTILRSYLENIEPEKLRVVYIFNAVLSFESLLKQIFNELGLVAAEGERVPGLVNHLHRFLIEEYKNERNVALIIDEAQNMPVETLENLRMLSNLETSKDKLVQIVMVGQPEFERKLELEELRQLKQRVAIRCRIKPLTPDESLAYIQHRLMKASSFHNQVFTKGALKRIIKEAGGFPRLINILCDNAMITGFGYQRNPVGKKIIKEVAADFRGGKPRRISRAWPIAAACTLIALFCLLFTKPLENWVSQEAPRVPGKEQVKLVPLPAPLPDLPVHGSVPVSDETSNAQQQVSVSGPTKETESVPESKETPLPEKQPVGEEPAAKSADAPDQEPPLVMGTSYHPKEKGPLKRIVIKGDSVSQVLLETYGYCDTDLIQLFRDANPQIKDVNKISVGVELQLPQLDSPKSQPGQ
jgi:general secretion pathway protein A